MGFNWGNFMQGYMQGKALDMENQRRKEEDELGNTLLKLYKESQPRTIDTTPQGYKAMEKAGQNLLGNPAELASKIMGGYTPDGGNSFTFKTPDMIPNTTNTPAPSGNYTFDKKPLFTHDPQVSSKMVTPTLSSVLDSMQGIKGSQFLKLLPYVSQMDQQRTAQFEGRRKKSLPFDWFGSL